VLPRSGERSLERIKGPLKLLPERIAGGESVSTGDDPVSLFQAAASCGLGRDLVAKVQSTPHARG
jgi:hypothetical protein